MRASGVRDLRLPALAAVAWGAQLAVPVLGGDDARWLRVLVGVGVAALIGALGGAAVLGRARSTVLAALLVFGAAGAVSWLHAAQVADNPVADLAEQRTQVRFTATVVADPRAVDGGFEPRVFLRARITEVTAHGREYSLRTPVLVFGGEAWQAVDLGASVSASGRLRPSETDDVAAVLTAGDPTTVSRPDLWWRGSEAVRQGIRDAVAHRPGEEAALVPALVDGDDTAVSDDLADDFRTTGLTHLLAVSGTNLTLVVGFLLVVARWVGVRGRWLYVVGALGILGFVLLARTEPSVVRAAAMGAVGLLAMGHNGRSRGTRGLGAAVLGLLLVDPGFAHSVGFALSVAATAGILLLAPAWRDALARWLPRWLAEAIAIPAAAQLAVTPIIAAISSEVSLVAVVANLLADPAVAPATVLGLFGGLLALVWLPAGQVIGTLATWCVGWIVAVAHRCADLPLPGVAWGSGPFALVVLTVLCAVIAFGAPRVLRRRAAGLVCCGAMVVVVAVRPPGFGGPPEGWAVAMCDVGQGDALAIATGPGSAVVVDVGPDPSLIDECLDDLGIATVPLLVVTHFHADHVDGSPGVFDGRQVGAVWTSPHRDPEDGVQSLEGAVAEAGVPSAPAPFGEAWRLGQATVQVLWPPPQAPSLGPGDGSEANDQSVVLLVESGGLRILLTGDVEPASQAPLSRALPDVEVDVLKVPHHGSRHQDLAWLESLHPDVALISVGDDNTYGHPSDSVLESLEDGGAEVHRTDVDGTVVLSPGDVD